MATMSVSLEKLDIGKVFDLALGVGRRNFGRFATISGLFLVAFILIGVVAVLAGGVSIVPHLMSARPINLEVIEKSGRFSGSAWCCYCLRPQCRNVRGYMSP